MDTHDPKHRRGGAGQLRRAVRPIIAIASVGEPPFVASETSKGVFVNASAGWVQVAMALASLSAIGLIWFVVDCRCCSAGWRKSTVAVRSRARVRDHAARVPAAGCERGCCLLRQRRPDLAVASYAFDAGSLGFANVWFALASFAAACGWLILLTRVVGRWLGWWAIATDRTAPVIHR